MAANFKSGIGQNRYKLVAGNNLRIGGIDIPCEFKLNGPFDADVLSLTVADALLGSAGLGGITDLVSFNDGMDSYQYLKEIEKIYYFEKIKIMSIDIIIQTHLKMVNEYKEKIKEQIQNVLFLKTGQLNLKINHIYESDIPDFITAYAIVLVKSG